MKYLLTISYIGSNYCGFQKQNNAISVQQVLTEAAEKVIGFGSKITGCSRTDSGVHALGFKATVEHESINVPCDKLPIAFNSVLPDDISVISAVNVDDDFHPRYSCKAKEYHYLIFNGKLRDPFLSGRAYFYPKSLDVEKMNKGAAYLIGTHDFSSYMASGSSIADTVRTIFSCTVENENDIIKIKIKGNGFLYNMVRIIAGTLINVGEGRIKPADVKEITESKDRSKAGSTAPPYGLYLYSVEYQ